MNDDVIIRTHTGKENEDDETVLAAVLCAVMALALLPATAQAADDAADLQAAIDGASATGRLTLVRNYQGAGSATSVSITSSLILDLNGCAINDITLNIGSSAATPAVTIKDTFGNGMVNCSFIVNNAINVHNGTLTVDSGRFIGDNINGIMIIGGSVMIRSGEIRAKTGIDYQGGKLTLDCADGKTASIASLDNSVSLLVASGKSVAVAGNTKVKIDNIDKTAADLTGAVIGEIALSRRSGTPPFSRASPRRRRFVWR